MLPRFKSHLCSSVTLARVTYLVHLLWSGNNSSDYFIRFGISKRIQRYSARGMTHNKCSINVSYYYESEPPLVPLSGWFLCCSRTYNIHTHTLLHSEHLSHQAGMPSHVLPVIKPIFPVRLTFTMSCSWHIPYHSDFPLLLPYHLHSHVLSLWNTLVCDFLTVFHVFLLSS